jgi:UDP:flavonoid glycosyltransferase YjiC (YdhE family)
MHVTDGRSTESSGDTAKALFLTADLGGNVPPTIAVAEALARRGVDVEIAGLASIRSELGQVPFPPATAIRPDGRARGARTAMAVFRLMATRGTARKTARLIAEQRPDLVVVDCMLPAVIRGALDSGVPVVVLFHTLGEFWMRSFDRGAAGRLFGMLGLRPSRLWMRAAARLLLTERELHPTGDDSALAGYTWVGTTEVGAPPERRSNSRRPRILVTLSSTDFPGMVKVYRRIIAALSDLSVDAIVTTAGVELGAGLEGPAHVEVTGWADHGSLLPKTDLVIGHGGHSTTLKALAHGVPVIVLPLNPFSDQPFIARVIDEAGVGMSLPKSAKPTAIRTAVQRLLADAELREHAAEMGRRMRIQAPGAEVAADRIVAILGESDAHAH